jgi:hypothetical protein
MQTPWGAADYVKKCSEGVYFVGTPSHGGVKLSASRNAQVHEAWRNAGGWYEEDCEWAVVEYTWPGILLPIYPVPTPREEVLHVLKNYLPHEYMAVTGEVLTPETSRVLATDVTWRTEGELEALLAKRALAEAEKEERTWLQ